VLSDRRHQERRRQQDRRNTRLDVLLAELAPLQTAVKENSDKIRQLENEQRVQFVRISQLQQELDELKKPRPG
jgi:hypothetical protein